MPRGPAHNRKNVPRYPGGQTRREHRAPIEERPEVVQSIVAAQRIKLGATSDNPSKRTHYTNERWGSWLGWCVMNDLLTEAQYQAGLRYAYTVVAWHRMHGLPPPTPKALDMGAVGGRPVTPDPDDETVGKINNRMQDLYYQINEASGRAGNVALRELIMLNTDPREWPRHTMLAARRGLQALVNTYRIDET